MLNVGVAGTPNNSFYKGKTVPNSPVSCCTKKDCQSLAAWRMVDGEYEIYMPYGYWYKPPQNVIRVEFTPNGMAHACWTEQAQMQYKRTKITVFCVWIPFVGV